MCRRRTRVAQSRLCSAAAIRKPSGLQARHPTCLERPLRTLPGTSSGPQSSSDGWPTRPRRLPGPSGENATADIGSQGGQRMGQRWPVGVPDLDLGAAAARGQAFAVGAPGDGVDGPGEPGQDRTGCTIGPPEANLRVASRRGQALTVGAPGDGADGLVVVGQYRPPASRLRPRDARCGRRCPKRSGFRRGSRTRNEWSRCAPSELAPACRRCSRSGAGLPTP